MFDIDNHGSIALIRPLTADVRDWLQENTGEEAQWFGGALVVEPRYLEPLVAALIEEGYAAQ
jgi:hypothetical protein